MKECYQAGVFASFVGRADSFIRRMAPSSSGGRAADFILLQAGYMGCCFVFGKESTGIELHSISGRRLKIKCTPSALRIIYHACKLYRAYFLILCYNQGEVKCREGGRLL